MGFLLAGCPVFLRLRAWVSLPRCLRFFRRGGPGFSRWARGFCAVPFQVSALAFPVSRLVFLGFAAGSGLVFLARRLSGFLGVWPVFAASPLGFPGAAFASAAGFVWVFRGWPSGFPRPSVRRVSRRFGRRAGAPNRAVQATAPPLVLSSFGAVSAAVFLSASVRGASPDRWR